MGTFCTPQTPTLPSVCCALLSHVWWRVFYATTPRMLIRPFAPVLRSARPSRTIVNSRAVTHVGARHARERGCPKGRLHLP